MKKVILLFASILVISCSDQLECEIQNLQTHNLKGNVKDVYSVTFDVYDEKLDFDFNFRNVPYDKAIWAEYHQYDDNGLCTTYIEYSIPWDNCKKSSYLVWGENGKPLELIKWDVDNDKYDDKVCHYEYSYNNNGQLIDTYDRMYDWLLNKKSKPVNNDQIRKDLNGYVFVTTQKDTIAALKFSKENGLTDFVHYNVVENKRYELAYTVRCNVFRKCYIDEGKVIKNEYDNGITETFEYSGNLMTGGHQSSKKGYIDYEYVNGYTYKAKEYDTGKNLVASTDYSYSGNIRKNGSVKWVTTEQSGKKTTNEVFFENGKNVKQVMKSDSTEVTYLKYNESGDLVSVKSENYSETRKYQYDEKGNWVVCFIYDSENKLKSVIQRVIKYGN